MSNEKFNCDKSKIIKNTRKINIKLKLIKTCDENKDRSHLKKLKKK